MCLFLFVAIISSIPDEIAVKIPTIHFGKKARGRLIVGTQTFEGTFQDLDNFVPQNLTRRQIVSKFSSLYDVYGKLTPVTAGMKLQVRQAVLTTETWDNPVSPDIRSQWVLNLWRLYKLQGIKFERARMPQEAVSTDLRLICAVDAASQVKIVVV